MRILCLLERWNGEEAKGQTEAFRWRRHTRRSGAAEEISVAAATAMGLHVYSMFSLDSWLARLRVMLNVDIKLYILTATYHIPVC